MWVKRVPGIWHGRWLVPRKANNSEENWGAEYITHVAKALP